MRTLPWRRSSYSSSATNCVEVAPAGWRTSSYSTSASNCVEVAPAGQVIAVRDSKDPDGGTLLVAAGPWASFVSGVGVHER